MFTEILFKTKTDVQPDSKEIPDSWEDLIAELHRFLDRLVSESSDKDRQDVFFTTYGGTNES